MPKLAEKSLKILHENKEKLSLCLKIREKRRKFFIERENPLPMP